MLIECIQVDGPSTPGAVPAGGAVELCGSPRSLLACTATSAGGARPASRSRTDHRPVTALLVGRGTCQPAAGERGVRQAAIAELEALIERAGDLGARRLSLAPAVVRADAPNRIVYGDALNRTADACLAVERHLARAGVRLALRASVDGFLTSPPELAELIAGLNSPVFGVDLDAAERCDVLPLSDWMDGLPDAVCAIGLRSAADTHMITVAEACGADAVMRPVEVTD